MLAKSTHLLSSNKGNTFGAIVVILFILVLVGMSGLLFFEKEKLTEKYVTVLEKT